MSLSQIKLCSLILRSDFGETVEKVCTLMLQKGLTPSGIIAQQTGLSLKEVNYRPFICTLYSETDLQGPLQFEDNL